MLGISSKGSSRVERVERTSDSVIQEASNAAPSSNRNSNNAPELDAFGFPIGTHDAQGRKFGQLDDLYTERDKLNAALTTYEQRREALNKEKYAVPLTELTQSTNASDTLKQEIETRATLIAINELITENEATIKAAENAIKANKASIGRMESQYNTIKGDRDLVSKGGRRYRGRTAYAKIALRDEGQKKRTAEVTLIRNPLDHDAEVMLSCANQNIEKWSNIEAALDAERQKYDDLMKIYRV